MATHSEMCVESLPRKPHVVTFDDALGALRLAPGAKGLGVVLEGWTDPIGEHDKKVIEVEQAMIQEKDVVSDIDRKRGASPPKEVCVLLYRLGCVVRSAKGGVENINTALSGATTKLASRDELFKNLVRPAGFEFLSRQTPTLGSNPTAAALNFARSSSTRH